MIQMRDGLCLTQQPNYHTLTAVFIAMTAAWCISSYYFMNHPLVASRIRHIGNIILPFVLIGLGIYILTLRESEKS
jgi:cadmium resistance protein CadD (predicted permease)